MDSAGGQSVVSSQTSSHGSSRSRNNSSLLEPHPSMRTSSQTMASYRPPLYYKDPGLRTSLTGPIPMQIAGEEVVRLPRILPMEDRQGELDRNSRNTSQLDRLSSFEGQSTRRTAAPLISRGSGASNQSGMTSSSSTLYYSFSSVDEGFILPPISSMTSQPESGNTNILANREQVFQESYLLATGRSLASNPLALPPHIPFGTPLPGNIPSFGF